MNHDGFIDPKILRAAVEIKIREQARLDRLVEMGVIQNGFAQVGITNLHFNENGEQEADLELRYYFTRIPPLDRINVIFHLIDKD